MNEGWEVSPGGQHSILASRSVALGFDSRHSLFFSKKNLMLPRFIDYILLRKWTVQSYVVDLTHLVLVSGKLFLQKVSPSGISICCSAYSAT